MILKVLSLVTLSSIINLIINISPESNYFTQLDSNWAETECVPTYGAWGTIEGCKIKAKVSPYDEIKKCWVYIGRDDRKYCEIIFDKPLQVHSFLSALMYGCIFMIFDVIFFGYFIFTLKSIIFAVIAFNVLLVIEINEAKRGGKVSFRRIFRFIWQYIEINYDKYYSK